MNNVATFHQLQKLNWITESRRTSNILTKIGAWFYRAYSIQLIILLPFGERILAIILIEQDHRFIKKITKPMMGFKAFYSAKVTIAGIETAYMIRKGLLSEENITAYQQFMALTG